LRLIAPTCSDESNQAAGDFDHELVHGAGIILAADQRRVLRG
jgi:hypothetical protein